MPRVGNKHFSYSPKGRAAARKEAKRKGMRVQMGKKYGKKK